jgi:exodeoxyribonuclease VII large subunit
MGRGALYEQFEALKARLSAEGLFGKERKRALPLFPSCIGVVTSPTGAALRDILNVLGRRWPLVHVLLSPTLVQGDRAPPQIVTALDVLYDRDDVELIIVARGGGSIEDLWAFNDERVARAIAAAPVPVISGVGHETDFTIADFCADVRAPTPSAAAEIAVPDQMEARGQLAAMCSALAELALQQTRDARQRLLVLEQLLAQCSPRFRVLRDRQGTDGLQQRLDRGCQHQVALLRERLLGMTHRLRGLDPYATLERGYAIVCREDGELVRRVAQVHSGDTVTVRVVDGDFSARVEKR